MEAPPSRTGPADKAGWRRTLLARRARLTQREQLAVGPALLAALTQTLRELPAGAVAAYAAVGTEPDTAPLLAARPDVLLPVLLPDGDLDWARADGGLTPGARGLLEPAGPRLGRDAVADCALVLVPALAVDRSGTRLGRGGGSYDRALTRTQGLVLAALHEGELVAELPAEPHDRPVHGAVLPSGLVRTRLHPSDSRPGASGGMSP